MNFIFVINVFLVLREYLYQIIHQNIEQTTNFSKMFYHKNI